MMIVFKKRVLRLLLAGSLLVLLVGLPGCDDDDSSNNSNNTNNTNNGNYCDNTCADVVAAACTNGPPDVANCEQGCTASQIGCPV
ncbi:hypothetical protein KJ612_10675, partial [Myxococcota bacterium]|nr:hypothetical protein [Myxococcota bacterium]